MPTVDLSEPMTDAHKIDKRFINYGIEQLIYGSGQTYQVAMKQDEGQRNLFRAASMEYLFSRVSPTLIRK